MPPDNDHLSAARSTSARACADPLRSGSQCLLAQQCVSGIDEGEYIHRLMWLPHPYIPGTDGPAGEMKDLARKALKAKVLSQRSMLQLRSLLIYKTDLKLLQR